MDCRPPEPGRNTCLLFEATPSALLCYGDIRRKSSRGHDLLPSRPTWARTLGPNLRASESCCVCEMHHNASCPWEITATAAALLLKAGAVGREGEGGSHGAGYLPWHVGGVPSQPQPPTSAAGGGQRDLVGATVGQSEPRLHDPQQGPQLGACVNVLSVIHPPGSNSLPSPLLCGKTPRLSYPAFALSPRMHSIRFSAWVTVFQPGKFSAHVSHRTDVHVKPQAEQGRHYTSRGAPRWPRTS